MNVPRAQGNSSLDCFSAQTLSDFTNYIVEMLLHLSLFFIFQTWQGLQPNEAFLLVNDHDPKPLFYQFMFERNGQFTWDYLEQGPSEWQVRIGRC